MCDGMSLIGIVIETRFATGIGVGSDLSPFHGLILIVILLKVKNEVQEVGEGVKGAFSADGGHEGIHEEDWVGHQLFPGDGCDV